MKKNFRSGLFFLIILMFLFADIGIISQARDNLTIKIPNQLFLVKTATPTPTPKFKVVEMIPIQPIMPLATAVPTSAPPPPPPPPEPEPVWQVKPFEPVFPIATAVPTWNIGLIEDLPFYEIPTPIPEWEIGVLEDLPFYEIPTLPLGGEDAVLESITPISPNTGFSSSPGVINFVWGYAVSESTDEEPNFSFKENGYWLMQMYSCSEGLCQYQRTLSPGNYTWQIFGSLGGVDLNTDPISFTILSADTAPSIPVLESPSGEHPTRSLSFTWQPSSAAESYKVVWTLEAGGSGELNLSASDASCLGGHCTIATTLPSEGKYSWYVIATNAIGSTNSSPMEFQVNPNINTPEGYLPNGQLDDPAQIRFEFSNVEDEVYEYRIRVNDSSSGEVMMDRSWNVEGFTCDAERCAISVDLKLPTGNYYWSVRGYSETSVSHWSNPLQFSIICSTCASGWQPPTYANTYPTPTYPVGAIQTDIPTFIWRAITGAGAYWLTAYDANGIVLLDVPVDKANCNYDYCYFAPGFKFPGNGLYSWKISGGTTAGVLWGSASANFSIVLPAEAIRFIKPENGGSIPKTAPEIQWTDPGSAVLSFKIKLWGSQQEVLLDTSKPRDASWCDGATCTLRFTVIPEALNYQIEVTPLSGQGVPGQAARLVFSVGESSQILTLSPKEGETVPTRPLFRWKVPDGGGTPSVNLIYYKIRLTRSDGQEVVFGPLICGESGVNCTGGEAYYIPTEAINPGVYSWKLEIPQQNLVSAPVSIVVQ